MKVTKVIRKKYTELITELSTDLSDGELLDVFMDYADQETFVMVIGVLTGTQEKLYPEDKK